MLSITEPENNRGISSLITVEKLITDEVLFKFTGGRQVKEPSQQPFISYGI